MAVYLVQHGTAHPAAVDPERRLTAEGTADVERIASVASAYKVHVSAIRHSGKKRARETADIFSSYLVPAENVGEVPGLGPNDDVAAFARFVDPGSDVMYVGHLPFMERLVSLLITGNTDTPVFRFQNGGIVCMEKEDSRDAWIIKWALMPRID